MAEEFANKIKRLKLENFTCFSEARFDFSPGINIFIGENGTGKTHLLKVIKAMTGKKEPSIFVNEIRRALSNYFKLALIEKLIRKGKKSGLIKIQVGQRKKDSFVEWSFKLEKGKSEPSVLVENAKASYSHHGYALNSILIPPQEMLSWQENFVGNNYKRSSGFDDTYFDLAFALDRGFSEGEEYLQAKKLVRLLEESISADIIKKDKKFYFRFHNNGQLEQEASVVAQGINKIGQLIYLILNGSLTKDTILFWDEPETGLNPKYITVVTKFLLTLANAGCQIFVSTHDYLLTHQLSLFAENRDVEENVPPMKFFALTKDNDGTEVESAGTVAEIQNNAILDEYAAYHELQMELAAKRFQTT